MGEFSLSKMARMTLANVFVAPLISDANLLLNLQLRMAKLFKIIKQQIFLALDATMSCLLTITELL